MPDVTPLAVNGVVVDDTFAEAFGMRGCGVLVTADHERWALAAARSMTGFATSVIACGCEAGIDRLVAPEDTPDGRPGVRVLVFAMSTGDLEKQVQTRLGQCVLTAPGSAAYAATAGETPLKLGDAIRYFGDGWQISKRLPDRHVWRIPVMDGEFVCEGTTGMTRGAVGGGNLILLARSKEGALAAAEAAIAAIDAVPDAIAPFPGGVVRSGSKIGGKYKGMVASTNDAWCPTLKGSVATFLDPDTESVLEIVIDGLSEAAVAEAMRAGIRAATALGPDRGASRISAGNYGGKLGKFHFRLRDLLP